MSESEEVIALRHDYWEMLYALLRAWLAPRDSRSTVTMTPPGRDADEIVLNYSMQTVLAVFTLSHGGIKYSLSGEEQGEGFVEFGKFENLLDVVKRIFSH